MVRIVWLLFIAADFAAIVALGLFTYYVSQPFNAVNPTSKTIIVGKGLGVRDIGERLAQEGIIHDDLSFTFYAVLSGNTGALQAGVYELDSALSVKEVVRILTGGEVAEFIDVTIPEGFNSNKIALRLASQGVVKNQRLFLDEVQITSDEAYERYGYEFLKDADAHTLEGFLFPDTYQFRLNSDPRIAVDAMLFNFDERTKELLSGVENPYEVLIIASLLQREVPTEEDMRLVAGVIQNRLEADMLLQIDATLIFVTGRLIAGADKQLNTPYNTYLYQGLPPGPIASPGLKALRAALNPEPSNYIFYVSGRDGTTHFAETLAEHNANVARYLR
jgi:UPF0755 protein